MGCSAGILSISLAKDLLKVHKNSTALVLSTESVSANVYEGKVKSMLRMGGAGILLSNRNSDRRKAKYELQQIVRTTLSSRTGSYEYAMQDLDDEGYIGVSLSRAILQVAGDALRINLLTLGALVLPYWELVRYGLDIIWKKIWAPARKRGPSVPNFKRAFNHFCIHAGGSAIIDTIKDKLKLTERDAEASKMTLYRFGNISSSSTWYSLSCLEAKGRVKKGDKIWQLAFGSGFKCNSAVWKCISELKPDNANAWSDRIDLYPVKVPDVIDH
ncbi:3-ketoacyl-CoA synthase 7-like [Coffea arabica]|uniref:very-long-chain 3-oxoacyl-CoA synthase n=1 Tax=Coffea arabica TaxID=13443 RepID=A0ABM4WQB8_COFAR